jgi:hypothetical protein|tara:strand:- start:692 stop:943 length:252 start_codon:yes stop_codon:yes gene_type:complete
MSTKDNNPDNEVTVTSELVKNDPLTTQILTDMLRIDQLIQDVKSLKIETKQRFDKVENWLIGIMGGVFTTLLAIVVALLTRGI